MAHPRNLPKQDLKAQYYSRRRSSMATTTSSSPTSASSSSKAQSSTCPLTVGQRSFMDKLQDRTVDALLERSYAVLQDWENKKGTPTPTMMLRTPPTAEKEAVKEGPDPAPSGSPSPSVALKQGEGAGDYMDLEVKEVKGKPVVSMSIPEAVELAPEVMEKSERDSLKAVIEGDADAAALKDPDNSERGMKVPNIITSFFPPTVAPLQPTQEESLPPPSRAPPKSNPKVPAVPSLPSHPPGEEPESASNTLVKMSASAGALKEWKPKPKIHDWFCVSHRSSTSTLDPYKCMRCTKRRAEAKSKSTLKK